MNIYRSGALGITAFSLWTALLLAGDQPWKDKKVPEWTEEDAKLVIADSPWAKTVTPELGRVANGGGQRPGGGMGRGGINVGGIGIGLPGGGMGRRGGGGYPQGGNTGGYPQGRDTKPVIQPSLTVRWESALPIREAELKARDVNAPTIDESHYVIAVYGAPRRMVEDAKDSELKKQAVIKRDGKKDLKPSSVQVLQREDGPVILYFFPRSTEITKSDRRLEFDAKIGRLSFIEPFFTEDMVYNGKLEL